MVNIARRYQTRKEDDRQASMTLDRRCQGENPRKGETLQPVSHLKDSDN